MKKTDKTDSTGPGFLGSCEKKLTVQIQVGKKGEKQN
jgi:hypothetical protein